MNTYMNEVAPATFNSFDTGRHPSGKSQPERFYHGFVLGLLVELRETPDQAIIKKEEETSKSLLPSFLCSFTEFQDPSLLFSELLYVHLPSLSEVL